MPTDQDPTVGSLDLPPTATVYQTGRPGGPKRAVHKKEDCPRLDQGNNVRDRALDNVSDDRPVCKDCFGVSAPRGGASDVNETRRALLDTSPEELGLAPLGNRSGDGASTGGEP